MCPLQVGDVVSRSEAKTKMLENHLGFLSDDWCDHPTCLPSLNDVTALTSPSLTRYPHP